MLTDITEACEILWSAKEFNSSTDAAIEIPFTEQMLSEVLTKHQSPLNTADIADTVLYENITVKEKAVSSVQKALSKGCESTTLEKKQQLQNKLNKMSKLLFKS